MSNPLTLLSSPSQMAAVSAQKHKTSIIPQFRIAVSLCSLFDMRAHYFSQQHFKSISFLEASKNKPLKKGPAFNFVSKLMSLNNNGQQFVSLSILSDFPPKMSHRVRASLFHHGMANSPFQARSITEIHNHEITSRALRGKGDFDIILSTNAHDILEAQSHGTPAGHVNPNFIPENNINTPLNVAFDFDRCISIATASPKDADFGIDEPEYSQLMVSGPEDINGLKKVEEREKLLQHVPVHPGPAATAFMKLCKIRDLTKSWSGMKTSLVTARTNGSLKRVHTTLDEWKVSVDHLESTGWDSKAPVINKLKADSLFDDSHQQIKSVNKECPDAIGVHLPWCPSRIKNIVNFYKPAI